MSQKGNGLRLGFRAGLTLGLAGRDDRLRQGQGRARLRPNSGEPRRRRRRPIPSLNRTPTLPRSRATTRSPTTGDFDLVDGIAWGPTRAGATAVYVTDKPIASPILGAVCPMAEARALSLLRDARWNEVDLDAKGKSRFYAAGTQFDGTSRSEDVGGHEWKFTGDGSANGRIAGKVTNKDYGSFEFDLPVRKPGVSEVSEVEQMDGGLSQDGLPIPDAAAVSATFAKIRAAALAKDLRGWLAAQGFSTEQIAAIRGLAGIDADMEQHALHYLSPETPKEAEEPEMNPGTGYVRGEGCQLRRREVHQLLLPRAVRRSAAAGVDRRESAVTPRG